jgi:hypothetical protein
VIPEDPKTPSTPDLKLAAVEDLGDSSIDRIDDLFKRAVTDKNVSVYYSRVVYGNDDNSSIKEDLDKYTGVIGILPWKIFKVDYHRIEKEDNYIDKFSDKIKEIIGVVDNCMRNPDKKLKLINEYIYGTTEYNNDIQ